MENKVHWLEPVAPLATSPAQDITLSTGVAPMSLHTPIHDRLIALKNEIDHVAPSGFWDDAKKITNPYEYIFLSLQRRTPWSVTSTQPLSRSYFKMIEMWDLLGLTAKATAHSAEGPGGFLEAIQDRITANGDPAIPMTAMTLKSTERTVPGWRKSQSFLQSYPEVNITYGADGTGNLYSLENQDAFAVARADVYTADGGFDFSADFNGQENTVQRLLIAEALAGLTTLNQGGTMILKLFDMKSRATLEFIWALSGCFDRTALMKPHTSRPANSERYWIGSGFHGASDWIIQLFRTLTATDAPNGWDHLFARTPDFPVAWITQIQAFQEQVELHQFLKIQLTLNLIRTPTREMVLELLTQNIKNSRDWCARHRMPLNRRYAGLTDEQVALQNLEEALVPFQASVARTNSPGLSRPLPTHRAWTVSPPPRTPVGLAWRTALPASVLGRAPSQTVGGTPPCVSQTPAPSQSAPLSDPVLAQP
jgi:23S rRNA U2552 (ribose-2'-O)-methylase RlmE/FtsJ